MVREGIIEVCDLCRKTYFLKKKEQIGGMSIYEDSELDSFGIGAFYYRICSTCSSKILTLAEQIQKDHEYDDIRLNLNIVDLAPESAGERKDCADNG
jgi:hypothetical protein